VTQAGAPDEGKVPEEGPFPDSAADEQTETEAQGNVIEGELATLAKQLDERTSDLQRVQAEYLNYKRRVDRDRDLIRENATYAALAPITEVLDTIDRARDSAAREGGELDGGFKAVAEQLERIVSGLGLTKFGAVGDPFDPTIHEALSHIGEDPDVEVTTCKVIAKAGYRIGDRVVRAAQVLVVDPVTGPADSPADTPADSPADTPSDSPVDEPTDAITEDDVRDVIEAIDEE
jgi:molecular chaperone GrpE